MSSTAIDDQLVPAVLESFQRVLRELRGGFISRTFMGEAPLEGFARQLSEIDGRGRLTGNIRSVWRITRDEITTLPVSFTIPPFARRSGMYYDRGTFDFVVARDGKSVVVSWQVGPRFGRGFRYQVITGEDEHPSLGFEETLWKS
jgi:hypothetical protein